MTSGRFLVEGKKLWNFFSQCSGSTVAEVPVLFWPAFTLRSLFYHLLTKNIWVLDAFAIAKASVIIILFYRILEMCTALKALDRVAFVSLMVLGNNLNFLLMNRPESSLVICILFCIYFYFHSYRFRCPTLFTLFVIFVFYFQATLHPQVVFFIILFAYLIYSSGCSKILKIFSLLSLTFISTYAYKLWSTYYACNGIPHIVDFLNSYTVSISDLVENPKLELSQIFQNFMDIFRVPYYLVFRKNWDIGYITYASIVDIRFLTFANILILCTSFSVYIYIFYAFLKFREIVISKYVLVSSLMLFSIVLWSISRGKYEYVTPLPWFVLCLSAAFSIDSLRESNKLNESLLRCFIFVIFISVFSSALFSVYYSIPSAVINKEASPHKNLALRRTEYMAGRNMSPPTRCDFTDLSTTERLVLDESTIFLYPKRPNIILAISGITGNAPNNIFDPSSYESLDASAFIVSCSRSYQLAEYADHKENDICCAKSKSLTHE